MNGGAGFGGERFFGGAHEAEQKLAVLLVKLRELVLLEQVTEEAVVEIIAAQRAVAAGGFHFKQAFGELQHRHVKRAAAQIVYHKRALGAVVEAVGNGSGGGLVEQAQHIEAGQARGIFGGLALGIVEISRHGNHGTGERAAQALFGACFEGAQNFGRHVNRGFIALAGMQFNQALVVAEAVGEIMVVGFEVGQGAPDQALGRADGVNRVDFLRFECIMAHFHARIFAIAHHRGQRGAALLVGEANGAAAFYGCHQAVGGAQIDACGEAVLVGRGGEAGFGDLQ